MGRATPTSLPGLVGAVVAATTGLLAWALLFGGGGRPDAAPGLGLAAIGLACLVLGLMAFGRLPTPVLDRGGRLALAAGVALVVLSGCSVIWSIAPDRSAGALGQGLVGAAFVTLGITVAAALGGRAARAAAHLVAGLLLAVLGWALVVRIFPALFPDAVRVARLRDPVGYWNALALLAGAAVTPGMWLVAGRSPARRVVGIALVQWSVVVVVLTQSRTGLVALLLVTALAFVLSERRVETIARALVAAGPGIGVAVWAYSRSALMDAGATRGDRGAAGAGLAVALVLALVTGSLLLQYLPIERFVAGRSRATVAILGALALAAVACVFAVLGSSELTTGECANDAGHQLDLCLNNRLSYWEDALEVARRHPLAGAGARTFAISRLRVRDDAVAVDEPHSVPLQIAADLGALGALLGALAAVGALRAIRRTFAGMGRDERAAGVALVGLPAAYGIHALVDYDLDFVAVTGPALFAAGVLVAAGRPRTRSEPRLLGAGAAAVVFVAGAFVLLPPWLADRELARADKAVEQGRYAEAQDAAARARSLDPLGLEPVLAAADYASVAEPVRARALYREAVDQQPENPRTHRALGLFEFDEGRMCAAYTALNDAYTLDPRSRNWQTGGELDQARDAVNRGVCETEAPA
jgi:tetratricopeptide (TPR) repeat protein